MFEAWGRALYRRRRLTLGVTLVLVAFAAVWGTGAVTTPPRWPAACSGPAA